MSSPDTRTPPPESDTESTRMLNFDEARFVRIQSGAVELAAGLAATVDKCLGDGAQNLFFLGSGGAGILMQPAAQLLQAQSGFPAFVHWPAELDRRLGSRHLGPQSIAVIPSLSGTHQPRASRRWPTASRPGRR